MQWGGANVAVPDVMDLLAPLGLSRREQAVQAIQTQVRRRLADIWDICPGSTVLEIGCGQGDMTLVLGAAVGPHGHVTAIDMAQETDGSPLTFAEATARIQRSPYGQTITFMFGTDILAPALSLPRARYDVAVLAHSSWYMASPDQLSRVLQRLAAWTDRLCLSEWDLQPTTAAQLPHAVAAIVQASIVAPAPNTGFNIRSLMARSAIERVVQEAGWHIEQSMSIDSTELQDGRWEVANCLDLLGAVPPSGNRRTLEGVDIDAMARLARHSGIEALASFVLMCRHEP
jgi:2-polyprenyl-3-methyl-5-hydroxy-6-metoxy-1,4-benzoquinol methylase